MHDSPSKMGGLIWLHRAKVGSKSPYGKKSVLKLTARQFSYFFAAKTELEFYVS